MEQTAKRGVFLSQINLGLSSPSSKARSCPHHFPNSQHSHPPRLVGASWSGQRALPLPLSVAVSLQMGWVCLPSPILTAADEPGEAMQP